MQLYNKKKVSTSVYSLLQPRTNDLLLGNMSGNGRFVNLKMKKKMLLIICGPGSSVDIATDYGLEGPGIESRWGRDFPHLSRPALGRTQPPVQWVPGLFRG